MPLPFAGSHRTLVRVQDCLFLETRWLLLFFVFVFFFVLAWISPWLVVPPLFCIVVLVIASLVVQQKMQELVEITQRATSQRNAILVESLVGIETVKFMVAESSFQRKWEHSTVFLAQHGTKLKLLSSSIMSLVQLLQQFVSVVMVIVGVYLLIDNQLSMGGIIAASMLAGRALAPFGQVAGLLMQYHNAGFARSCAAWPDRGFADAVSQCQKRLVIC